MPIYPHKSLFIIFFLMSGIGVFAQNTVIDEANSLIAIQRYASAYRILSDSDPNDQNPDIAIARTSLLVDFYIQTDKFHAFALKDLAPNQNVKDFRDAKKTYEMIKYKPDSILTKLIAQYPNNYKLYYALGNFYYEVHLRYPDDNWILPDSVLVDNVLQNFKVAYDNGVYDYWSLFGIGYAYLLTDNDDEAIKYLENSVILNPEYPISQYNLASAYYNKKEAKKALPYALKAYQLQTIIEYKVETAMLIASIYKELNDKENALVYLSKVNELYPRNYNILVPLLELEVELDKPDCLKHASELFKLDPANPIIYQDIMKAFCENEMDKDYIAFLEAKRHEYRSSLPVIANIHLYLAIAQYGVDEWVSAKINFEKARSLFKNFYKQDHNVFKVIDSYTEAIKKKKKQ